MLDRLVRPLVRTQIQLLTKTQSASNKLMKLISQWLGYLGVQADVTQLQTQAGKIQISVAVGKPDQCSDSEWSQILCNINEGNPDAIDNTELTYAQMPTPQQRKVEHLLAMIIHAGNPTIEQEWDQLQPRLLAFDMNASLLTGIKTALHATTTLECLLTDLEPEVAAFVLSRAIRVALIDQQITPEEDTMLKAIYSAIETKAKV
ncbi:hypothetical protein IQ266_20465 [filamentous cyanobacterium LEGE 11480]|uniref:Uncharacterized protein n=1 Tax=Romeriopsis navalis LEGE 11480 TaxID=2777977 RepID=A0A928Z425_9CYAN|nr:hypothetical protein [Romeriopsis navalis]MBE9032116.1 hypothetical protein [Romeriopsis navalis LEGE 11480]